LFIYSCNFSWSMELCINNFWSGWLLS